MTGIVVVRTAAGMMAAAEQLASIGYEVDVSLPAPGRSGTIKATLMLRIVGRALPDELTVNQGDSLVIGLGDKGQPIAAGALPSVLCEPLEREAGLLLG